jgi:hypothetical protein
MDETCFQPGGQMEGRRDKYLANQTMKAHTHLANVEEIQQREVTIDTVDESIRTEEFAAMSLSLPNDINFTSYPLSSPDISLHKGNMNPAVLATLPEHFNTALNSACTNHII